MKKGIFIISAAGAFSNLSCLLLREKIPPFLPLFCPKNRPFYGFLGYCQSFGLKFAGAGTSAEAPAYSSFPATLFSPTKCRASKQRLRSIHRSSKQAEWFFAWRWHAKYCRLGQQSSYLMWEHRYSHIHWYSE